MAIASTLSVLSTADLILVSKILPIKTGKMSVRGISMGQQAADGTSTLPISTLNTGGGIRTHTLVPQERILSPQRLPFRHAGKRAPIDPSESARHKHTEVRLPEAIRARSQGPTTDVERSIGPDGAAERRFRSCVDVRSRTPSGYEETAIRGPFKSGSSGYQPARESSGSMGAQVSSAYSKGEFVSSVSRCAASIVTSRPERMTATARTHPWSMRVGLFVVGWSDDAGRLPGQ